MFSRKRRFSSYNLDNYLMISIIVKNDRYISWKAGAYYMELQNVLCRVSISTAKIYPSQNDRMDFDYIYNPQGLSEDELFTTHIIYIETKDNKFRIAVIGDYHSYDTNCAVLEDSVLTVLQNDVVVKLDTLTGKMLLKKNISSYYDMNYAIYKVSNGYIIHGEIEILGLDNSFDTVWRFEGNDIWETASDLKPFEIIDECIILNDFEGNRYVLDMNGNILNQKLKQEVK